MIACQRWSGIFTLSVVGLICGGGRLCAQSNSTVVEPAAIVQPDMVLVEPLPANLWTATGRPRTFVDRDTRAVLENVPIVDRPNRLFHFYGNAVRRRNMGDGESSVLGRARGN